MFLFNLFSVGLSSTRNFRCAGHVVEGGALDQAEKDRSVWIVWTRSPPDLIKRTCFKEGVITAQINTQGSILIVGSRSNDGDQMRYITLINVD